MRTQLLVVSLLLVCLASTSWAGGVNLTWSTLCWTDEPISVKTFACNTNVVSPARTWPLTASFVLDTDLEDFVGVEIWMEAVSNPTELPDWWKLGAPPDCRAGRATFEAGGSYADVECHSWAVAGMCELLAYTWDTNRIHVYAAAVLDTLHPVSVVAGEEYVAGTLAIANGATTGTGSCAGCSYPVLWGIAQIDVLGAHGARLSLGDPAPNGNQCVDWNNSWMNCYPVARAGKMSPGLAALPCTVTPARGSTWGAVKSLYR